MQASALEFVPSFFKASPTQTQSSPYAMGDQGPQYPTYNTKQTTPASLMLTVGICSMIALDAYSDADDDDDDDDEEERCLCDRVESTANQKDKAQPTSFSMMSPCPSTFDGSNASCSSDSDCETSDQEPEVKHVQSLRKALEHDFQQEDQVCQSTDIEVDAESTRPWRKRSWMAKPRSDAQVVEAHFQHAPWRKESAKQIVKAAPWRKTEGQLPVLNPPEHVGQPDEQMRHGLSIQMLLKYRCAVEPQHRTEDGLWALEMGPPESDTWAERQSVAREMVMKDAPWCEGDTDMIISAPPGLRFSIRMA